MPTGYTAGILDGKITTFPQFAKLCMRAFGATMHMRDEGMDAEYQPNTPSNYYSERIEAAKQALKEAQTLSDEDIVSAKKDELEKSKHYHNESIIKIKEDAEKMNQMLKEVRAWQPPTSEHQGIKDFMIEQLEKTIDFDCKTEYHDKALIDVTLELLTLKASSIRASMVSQANKDLAYYTENHNKEVKRCEESNKWVTDFINSLPLLTPCE